MTTPRAGFVDGLQFCHWSRATFEQMREAGLSAVHATVAYHEGFRPTVDRIVAWNWRFRDHADLILPGRSAADLMRALSSNRTAIILGLQTPLPIEDDLGLVTVLHELGIRVMQLTYNNQSLLGCGWQEAEDSGLTRMGREVIARDEPARHADRPVARRRAHRARGDRSRRRARSRSPTPRRRPGATASRRYRRRCCGRWRRAAACSGCRSIRTICATGRRRRWRRSARWRRARRRSSGRSAWASARICARTSRTTFWPGCARASGRARPRATAPTFPPQPAWFQDARGFANLADGLRQAGFAAADMEAVLGTNWQRFFRAAFRPGVRGAA